MIRRPPRGLFITGTSTEVGKTYVACQIVQQLSQAGQSVGVYKPAASGARREHDQLVSEDAERLWQAAGCPGELKRVCPQVFAAPLAPHLAVRAEGREIDEQLLVDGLQYWSDQCDVVVVEGAGGLMSPVSDELYVADLAWEFGYPLVVVAANVLGVINQTLQTLIVASTFRDGLKVAGVVLNDVTSTLDLSGRSNLHELRKRCVPPILDHVRYGGQIRAGIEWGRMAAEEG